MGNREGSAVRTASSGAGVRKLISGPVYVNLVSLKTKCVGSFQGPHGPGLIHTPEGICFEKKEEKGKEKGGVRCEPRRSGESTHSPEGQVLISQSLLCNARQ